MEIGHLASNDDWFNNLMEILVLVVYKCCTCCNNRWHRLYHLNTQIKELIEKKQLVQSIHSFITKTKWLTKRPRKVHKNPVRLHRTAARLLWRTLTDTQPAENLQREFTHISQTFCAKALRTGTTARTHRYTHTLLFCIAQRISLHALWMTATQHTNIYQTHNSTLTFILRLNTQIKWCNRHSSSHDRSVILLYIYINTTWRWYKMQLHASL